MRWPGYDEWRVHGNTHTCEKCGKTWQDFEGGCSYCPPVVTCFSCGVEFDEHDCDYVEICDGHICKDCPPEEVCHD